MQRVLLERSSDIASFVEHPVYSIFKMYSVMILNFFYFNLLLLIQSACVKVNFQVLRERSSDIASFVEHPVYSIFKMQSVLILVVLFDLSLFTQSVCIKDIYSQNFRCSAKEAAILLLSRSTQDIAISKCKASSFQFSIFIYHYSPKMYL